MRGVNMKMIAAALTALALLGGCAALGAPQSEPSVIEFDDGVVVMSQEPCSLGGTVDPESPLKSGVAVFDDRSRQSISLCWVEEDGQIWIVDQFMSVFSIDADRVKPLSKAAPRPPSPKGPSI